MVYPVIWLSHGSKSDTPKSSKCLVLRVATVRPCSRAVAARRPSMLPNGFPCCCDRAASIAQRLEIVLVTGRRLFLRDHPPNPAVRDQMVENLHHGDTIISFNYDLVIERALRTSVEESVAFGALFRRRLVALGG